MTSWQLKVEYDEWDASSNTPELIDEVETLAGKAYIVSGTGTLFSITWAIGDILLYNEAGNITKVSGTYGSVYYDITNPTNALSESYKSNGAKYTLYDGSTGRTTPTIKYTIGDISLSFNYVDEDNSLIKDTTSELSLETIIKNRYLIRIKTHTGSILEGYLVSMEKPWKLGLFNIGGVAKTMFDLSCVFDVKQEL